MAVGEENTNDGLDYIIYRNQVLGGMRGNHHPEVYINQFPIGPVAMELMGGIGLPHVLPLYLPLQPVENLDKSIEMIEG